MILTMPSPHESLAGQSAAEITLRHQAIEIPTDRPLISLEESRRIAEINAAIVAEISLPITNPAGEPMKLRLLDFGEDITEKGKALFYMPDIGDMRHVATSRSRFALTSANYVPETHMIAFCELPLGSETTIGREATSHPSYLLGLSDDIRPSKRNEANRKLSRQQFTIAVTEQGDIRLEDHSTNGTDVKLAS
jgi:hypothetical protein